MENPNSTWLTNDDKMISLFCHLSIFIGGIIVPIILWAIYKDKSRFIKFNAVQALVYQIIFTVILALPISVLSFLSVLADDFNYGGDYGSLTIELVIAWAVVLVFMTFLFYIPAVYIGIKSYKGQIRKYFIIGNIVYNKVYGNQ